MSIIKRLEALESKHKPLKLLFFNQYTKEQMAAEKKKQSPETRLINFVTAS